MKLLIVVDMQNDFVSCALGTQEAEAIVPSVVKRVEEAAVSGEIVYFTRDTHKENYLDTQEGKKLPVPHCIEGSHGWQIIDALQPYVNADHVIDKPTFGSRTLAETLRGQQIEQITLIGLCTDICVISNALLLKAFFPEVPVAVDASCCAGVTPESHKNALASMKCCQIDVVNE